MTRANPAVAFMAHYLAEQVTGKPWRELSRKKRMKWAGRASDLLSEMYRAGFTIPMPANPDAIWDSFEEPV